MADWVDRERRKLDSARSVPRVKDGFTYSDVGMFAEKESIATRTSVRIRTKASIHPSALDLGGAREDVASLVVAGSFDPSGRGRFVQAEVEQELNGLTNAVHFKLSRRSLHGHDHRCFFREEFAEDARWSEVDGSSYHE